MCRAVVEMLARERYELAVDGQVGFYRLVGDVVVVPYLDVAPDLLV